ncbi:MAG: phosphatidylglycerophosphatase A [Acidobacteria bacterium]|nr:MAG: phosphatidylglycerophosphatase A [Acidobacteriota bacterium]
MTGLVRRAVVGFATVGPIGFAPIAPGTAGSVVGLALFWAVRSTRSTWLEVAMLLVVTGAGVAAASAAEARYRRRDPGLVVIDEVAGMLVTLVAVPVGVTGALIGFFAFRLFDIVKPFPARQAERLPGGWGVMVDDLVAGLYAQALLRLVLWLGAAA